MKRPDIQTMAVVSLAALAGCGPGQETGSEVTGVDGSESSAGSTSTSVGESGTDASSAEGQTTDTEGAEDGPKYDVEDDETSTTGGGDACKVEPDGDGVPPCEMTAPPDSFEPVTEWEWHGGSSVSTPLVANLTDDNDDGEIDLCDIPDIVVMVYPGSTNPGQLHVLDGATGAEHYVTNGPSKIRRASTAAIGDIDDDGIPEIVTQSQNEVSGPLGIIAFEHDGTFKWHLENPGGLHTQAALSLADVDNDGDVEILAGSNIVDHEGNLVQQFDASSLGDPHAVDLDDDEDLEIVYGRYAYHHDGGQYYSLGATWMGRVSAIADFDDDGQPEIIGPGWESMLMLEHDGAIKLEVNPLAGYYGAAVHDLDGDGAPEIAQPGADYFAMLEADLSVVWSNATDDSGTAVGTAFDFLGDGTAESVYADETKLWVFDELGQIEMSLERNSPTIIEYPVVADVDNDGSAEIVIVSSPVNGEPTVHVFRDAEDRWVQARRIWNQHNYHVTNVREDGSIPQFEQPHWQDLNTWRTNAQIEDGGTCMPIPEG